MILRLHRCSNMLIGARDIKKNSKRILEARLETMRAHSAVETIGLSIS